MEKEGAGGGEEIPNGTWIHHRQSDIRLGELLDKELREVMKRSGVDAEGEWGGCGLR